MNFNQLKAIANECVFSMEGVTIMKTEEYNYRLQQIDQLTNNWNELEEWIKQFPHISYTSVEEVDGKRLSGILIPLDDILDKMKEIKDDNNDNN